MKRILITGITGYIGSNLARRLLPECEVYGLVREPLNLTYLEDIQEQIHFVYYDGTYESMSNAVNVSQPDLVYHLATYYTGAHGREHTPRLISSNITLGAYLLEVMADWGCSALVNASTVMAYYKGEGYRPLNLYAATKQALSDLMAYYTDAGLVRAVTLMLSDTYGPNDHRPKILNLIKKAVQSGEKLALSEGGQDYDLVHIDDVTRAFQAAGKQLLQNPGWKDETFQIGAGKVLTLRETVECMLQVNQVKLNAGWGERPSPEREIRQAVRVYPPLPGWQPEVSLENGLRDFVDGYSAGNMELDCNAFKIRYAMRGT